MCRGRRRYPSVLSGQLCTPSLWRLVFSTSRPMQTKRPRCPSRQYTEQPGQDAVRLSSYREDEFCFEDLLRRI